MYINIELEQNGQALDPIPFKIEIDELTYALENCYTQLGTPYDPIKIDNFVTVGKNAFSLIDKETQISISLEKGSHKNHAYEKKDLPKVLHHKLVCCKVKIVDKKFINLGKIADKAHWSKLFEYNSQSMLCAPDGTLYVSPNGSETCVVNTKKLDDYNDCNISYSILIALKLKFKKEKPRRFYLILDPLVKVSAHKGTKPPVT